MRLGRAGAVSTVDENTNSRCGWHVHPGTPAARRPCDQLPRRGERRTRPPTSRGAAAARLRASRAAPIAPASSSAGSAAPRRPVAARPKLKARHEAMGWRAEQVAEEGEQQRAARRERARGEARRQRRGDGAAVCPRARAAIGQLCLVRASRGGGWRPRPAETPRARPRGCPAPPPSSGACRVARAPRAALSRRVRRSGRQQCSVP